MILVAGMACLNSCISRLNRPAIVGYIYDYDNRPVPGCKVGETVTDEQGKFYLEEVRSNRFLLTEIFAMEAPPSFFVLDIQKDGYQSYRKDFFNRYGGGRLRGAFDNFDTLYIKRVDEVVLPERYIYNTWHFAANKNLDTLYGTNPNYRIQNMVTNNPDFDQKFSYGLVHKYQSTAKPDTAWTAEYYDLETSYYITLHKDGTYQGKKVRKYLNAWRHRMEYDRTYRESYTLPSDSVMTEGKFTLSKRTIRFDQAFNPSGYQYQIDSIDRDVMILTKVKQI